MVQLENISQKATSRELTHRPIAILSHTVNLQTIL